MNGLRNKRSAQAGRVRMTWPVWVLVVLLGVLAVVGSIALFQGSQDAQRPMNLPEDGDEP